MADSLDRSAGPKAQKFKGSFTYNSKFNESWFEKESLKVYKDTVCKSKLGNGNFFCQICNKDVSCSHDGSSDLVDIVRQLLTTTG